MVASRNGCLTAQRAKDVIDLNLMQFGNANEYVYFADPARVERTLETFRRREDILRPSRPAVSEANAILPDNLRATVLKMDPITRRLSLPRGIDLRRAARETGKFRNGDGFVRIPCWWMSCRAKPRVSMLSAGKRPSRPNLISLAARTRLRPRPQRCAAAVMLLSQNVRSSEAEI